LDYAFALKISGNLNSWTWKFKYFKNTPC
jgi:hypothetical protein